MKQPIIVSIASMLVAACGGGEGDAAEDIGREALFGQSTLEFRPAAPLATRLPGTAIVGPSPANTGAEAGSRVRAPGSRFGGRSSIRPTTSSTASRTADALGMR